MGNWLAAGWGRTLLNIGFFGQFRGCRAKQRIRLLDEYGFLFSVHDVRRRGIREEEPVLVRAVWFKGPGIEPREFLKSRI